MEGKPKCLPLQAGVMYTLTLRSMALNGDFKQIVIFNYVTLSLCSLEKQVQLMDNLMEEHFHSFRIQTNQKKKKEICLHVSIFTAGKSTILLQSRQRWRERWFERARTSQHLIQLRTFGSNDNQMLF